MEFTDGGGYDEDENGEDDPAAAAAAAAGASSSSSCTAGEVKRGRGRPRKSQFAQVTYVVPFATLQSDPSVRLDDADFWEKALPKSNTRVGRLKALFEDDEQVRGTAHLPPATCRLPPSRP